MGLMSIRTTFPLILTLLLLAAQARASGPPVRVDRRTVIQRAQEAGPGMLVARAGKAASARSREAADTLLSLPPRVELEVARHAYPGGAGMDVVAALWQDLSLGGLGRAKHHVAAANVRARELELELARRQAIHQGMLAWIDAIHARALLQLRTQSVALAQQMVTITGARVRAGAVPPVELTLAASVLGSSRAALIDARGRMIDADANLRHALGLEPDVALEVVGDLRRSDDRRIDERKHIEWVQREHPLVKLALVQVQQADARAELEASRGRPVLGVGVSYAREATGDRVLGAMVSVPLPVLNPAAFDASLARGEAHVANMRAREVGAALAKEVRLALHARTHARELRAALQTGALTPGREALGELIKRYEAGAVGLAETLSARRELLAVEEATLSTSADVHRADADFALLASPVLAEGLP
jgi:cobalt-zinc-cadmium efflux system outer membrane protein